MTEGKVTHEWRSSTTPWGEECKQCKKCLMLWFEGKEPQPTGRKCFEATGEQWGEGRTFTLRS